MAAGMQMLMSWYSIVESRAGTFFLASSVILLAEYLFPQSRYPLIARIRGATFWLLYISITALSLILFYRLWAMLGVTPLFHIDLSALSSAGNPVLAVLGGVVASLLVLQVHEFFYYWFHRAQHKSRFLWRFHSEHHSLEEMCAFNSNHHFTEEIFRIPFVIIPISLLFSFEQGYVPWIWAALIGWQGIYEHSATKFHFGWFRYVVPDNRFHRIHHSKERKHFDKNFGSGSALWDILFGTAYYPKNDEWPDVGLKQMKQPETMRQYLFRPFRR